jgi:hypothetical protein
MSYISRQLTQIVAVIVLLSFTGLSGALAQDKGGMAKGAGKKGEPVTKVLVDNDKVRVYETTFQPGDVSPSRARVARVVRYLSAGTLQRVYPDGKTEDRKVKVGDTVWITPDTYAVKNVGKTKVTVYGVELKSK